jgi:cell division protein FtsW
VFGKKKPEKSIKESVRIVEDDAGMMDMPYLLLTILLVVIGLIMLFSASFARAYHETGNSASNFLSQSVFAAGGIGVMFVFSRFPYDWYRKFALTILGGALLLLALVPLIGVSSNGAQRWLSLGFTQFQPSEVAKFAVIISFAAIMSAHPKEMKTMKYGFAPYMIILGVIAGLLMLEPHMSATIIILLLGFILMAAGGTNWKFLVGLAVVGVVVVAIYLLTMGYTADRITAWLNPESDPLDDGLQILQSQYAIGSGGLLGLGFGKSRQKYLYLPEEHNDYIFAIVCEELGFIGAVGILLLFALLIIRGFWIAMHARDRFSMLTATGLTTLLAVQVILNVAVVTNLLPATGISLPFFSSGGTALIMQLAESGIVLNISRSITQSPPRAKKGRAKA